MASATQRQKSVKLHPTGDGIHLDDSILWFDSHSSAQLSFLSAPTSALRPSSTQMIATRETARILETWKIKINALICEYNRPFSIGRLRMELLPSGCMLGGASLLVETGVGSVLYAPELQTHRMAAVRQAQLKRANSLILGTHHPHPSKPLPSRRREVEALVEMTLDLVAKGTPPVIICEPVGTAQEITKILNDQKVHLAAHSSIAKINRIYETFGSHLGPTSVFSQRRTRNKAILMPLPKNHTRIPSLPDGPVILVKQSSSEHDLELLNNLAGTFTISNSCDGADLKEVILATRPKELFLFGPFAKSHAEEYAGMVPKITPLFPNFQPTLF